MIEEFSVLPWHKGKWFCPIWANQWQQVFPDTIFKPLRPTLTLLVCSTKPWLEGGERERLFVFVTWIKSLYVYGMLEGLLFMHYPSMRAIDGRLNSQGQWSNCHKIEYTRTSDILQTLYRLLWKQEHTVEVGGVAALSMSFYDSVVFRSCRGSCVPNNVRTNTAKTQKRRRKTQSCIVGL